MSSWTSWLQQHRVELQRETPYEWEFARLVLAMVPGLDPDTVTVQKAFEDSDGKPRRMDFAVLPANGQIAIEVDGFDKSGTGHGMNSREFADFLLRQTSLAAQGWLVLRFANGYFSRHPDRCIRQIELAIRTCSGQVSATPQDRAELQELQRESNDVDELRRRLREAEQSSEGSRRTRNRAIAVSVAAVLVAGGGAVIYAKSRSDGQIGVPSKSGTCPAEAQIKGNRSQRTSERIYHVPGQRYYNSTTAIRCFATEDDAAEAGYRRSKV